MCLVLTPALVRGGRLKPVHAECTARPAPGAHGNDIHAVVAFVPLVSDDRLIGFVSRHLGPTSANELRLLPAPRRQGHAASRLALDRALRSAEAPETSGSTWRSLAHSGRAGLAVVAPVPVGADLEPEARFDATFAARVADFAEIGHVIAAGIPSSLVPAAVWTAKEAALKATGRGLRVHPRNARVVSRIEGGWRVQITDRRCGDSDWNVVTFGLPGWRLAVACPAGAGPVRLSVLELDLPETALPPYVRAAAPVPAEARC